MQTNRVINKDGLAIYIFSCLVNSNYKIFDSVSFAVIRDKGNKYLCLGPNIYSTNNESIDHNIPIYFSNKKAKGRYLTKDTYLLSGDSTFQNNIQSIKDNIYSTYSNWKLESFPSYYSFQDFRWGYFLHLLSLEGG